MNHKLVFAAAFLAACPLVLYAQANVSPAVPALPVAAQMVYKFQLQTKVDVRQLFTAVIPNPAASWRLHEQVFFG